ncbi:MAG: hypothetical protein ACHQHN_04120 [Sphingobacteriales bacterium]
MKHLIIIALFSTLSFSAFAQFPLGANKENITTYFAVNVQYASAQEYKTKTGEALCFTKVRVVGDYTFQFNDEQVCTSYTETYGTKQINDVIWRMDRKFCRISGTEWTDEDGNFKITLVLHPKKGANFISVVYKPVEKPEMGTTLAAN